MKLERIVSMQRLRHLMRFRLLQMVTALFFLSGVYFTALADDVYNFYFQKSPTIVNGTQNGKKIEPKAAPESKVEEATPTTSPTAPPATSIEDVPVVKSGVPDWEISTGYSWMSGFSYAYSSLGSPGSWGGTDYNFKGARIGLQYNFSDWIGARFNYSYVKLKSSSNSYDPNAGPINPGGNPSGVYNSWSNESTEHLYSIGAAITPVRIQSRSHDFLTIGSVAGMTRTIGGEHRFFVEPEASLFFSRALGVRFQFRYVMDNEIAYNDNKFDGPDSKVYTASLVTRF